MMRQSYRVSVLQALLHGPECNTPPLTGITRRAAAAPHNCSDSSPLLDPARVSESVPRLDEAMDVEQ
jgi:hypothetical protein